MKQNYYLACVIFYFLLMISCQGNRTNTTKDNATKVNATKVKVANVNAANVNARKAEPARNIVGTWKIIEYADLNYNGEWEHPYGKVKGYFTYTKNNIVNLNLSNEIPMDLSRDASNTQMMTYKDLWTNSVGYFGKYSVDYERSILTHHVEGGSIPWYVGTDQRRPFYFEGDTLVIGYKSEWIRKLIKVD